MCANRRSLSVPEFLLQSAARRAALAINQSSSSSLSPKAIISNSRQPTIQSKTGPHSNYNNKPTNTVINQQQVTLPLVASHLFNKGFNREFIAHLMAVVSVLARKIKNEPCHMILSASKDQLAIYLSDHPNTTDEELEKLHETIAELSDKNGKMSLIRV